MERVKRIQYNLILCLVSAYGDGFGLMVAELAAMALLLSLWFFGR